MLSVLSVLCPPLAVLLVSPGEFASNLGRTLLFFVPGVLHARAVVERAAVSRRYARLQSILAAREPQPRRATRPRAQVA